MLSPHQTMLVQGLGQSGPFTQGGPGGMLQGPLAYLEKTTSNIGKCLNNYALVLFIIFTSLKDYVGGLTDGRR